MAAKTKQKGTKSDKAQEGNESKPKKKVMVPRKKLQNVPDLLARGPDGTESEPEPIWVKLLWMSFLLLLFYLSFDYFLKHIDGPGEDSQGDL